MVSQDGQAVLAQETRLGLELRSFAMSGMMSQAVTRGGHGSSWHHTPAKKDAKLCLCMLACKQARLGLAGRLGPKLPLAHSPPRRAEQVIQARMLVEIDIIFAWV